MIKSCKKLTCIIFLLILFLAHPELVEGSTNKADIVIFSYDRPLTLEALLDSLEEHVTGIGQTTIVYRASSNDFAAAYAQISNCFPKAVFYKQGAQPANDFKPLTLKAAFDSPNEYLLFAVDDNIVTDTINLSESIEALKKTGAYAFFLRLGKNINHFYTTNIPLIQPPLKLVDPSTSSGCAKEIVNKIYSWQATDRATGCWAYPNNVDMTLYKKRDIIKFFVTGSYSNPNVLEARWAHEKKELAQKKFLCYEYSRITNIPLNRVQTTYNNKSMDLFTPQELLVFFNEGLTIDRRPLWQLRANSCHVAYEPVFCKRS